VDNVVAVKDWDLEDDAELRRDHFTRFDALREECPYFFSTAGEQGFWVFTRYDQITSILQRPEEYSNRVVSGYLKVRPTGPLLLPEQLDPPHHRPYRKILNPLLSPQRVAAIEPEIRERTRAILHELAVRGRCDVMTEFAKRFAAPIVLALLGLDEADSAQFVADTETYFRLTSAEDPDGALRSAAAARQHATMQALIEARRSEPRADIATALVEARIDGEPLPEDDLRNMALFVFMASLDSTAGVLGFMLRFLATSPEHRRALAADPTLATTATEELLRYFAVSQVTRVANQDEDIAGCPVQKGDRIILPLNMANRDGTRFERADEVLLDRRPNRHIAFGLGPHRCAGSHLARTELRVALEEWHRIIPEYHLEPGADTDAHVGGLAVPKTVPIVFDEVRLGVAS
jgi:cytochrome P450